MKKVRYAFLILLSFLYIQCNRNPYAASNKKYKQQAKALGKVITGKPLDTLPTDSIKLSTAWIGTTNFGLRKPNFVVIHHTAQQSCEQTLQTFTIERSQVSAHYVICKDGTLHHLLNNYFRAWHAGAGKWGNVTDINSSSIGIELDNNGFEPFSPLQIQSLTALLTSLKKTYNIPDANFIAHADIAPGRKVDPNKYFPWEQLSKNGFGIWYGDTSGLIPPVDLNPAFALRIIGYDISKLQDAIQSFRLHYLQSEEKGLLSEPEKKILYALLLKYL